MASTSKLRPSGTNLHGDVGCETEALQTACQLARAIDRNDATSEPPPEHSPGDAAEALPPAIVGTAAQRVVRSQMLLQEGSKRLELDCSACPRTIRERAPTRQDDFVMDMASRRSMIANRSRTRSRRIAGDAAHDERRYLEFDRRFRMVVDGFIQHERRPLPLASVSRRR